MIKQKIIEQHGRIVDIVLFDKEPKEEDLQNLVLAKEQRAQNELIRAEIARIEEDDDYG